jgi:hypothetical protein
MIGPGGLLLVVSQLFAVPVSVRCMGGVSPPKKIKQKTKKNLDVSNIFSGYM